MEQRKPRILVVEDEAAIRTGLADVLVYHGYEVDAVADGKDGLAKALSGRYDLLLLDVMLPGRDGFAICDEVRKVDRAQPIIMLTAKTSDEDIVNGLTLGADDYVAKPFAIAQLVLRVKAVLRRTRSGPCRARSCSRASGATTARPTSRRARSTSTSRSCAARSRSTRKSRAIS
jgi:DNA-binding response OmpR family regulator